MTTTELLALFRSEVRDLELPYLWSDAQVYGFIDDAQKIFCRDTYGVADARQFTIAIAPDAEWYTISPLILKLRDAVNSVTGRSVPIIAVEKMEAEKMKFNGIKGPIRALISGLEKGVLRAWPIPTLAVTLNLLTFRLPADVGAGDDLEIDPQHHRHLLYWVKYLAYDVQDAETYDKQASDKYRAKHDAYCAKALNEQSRASHSAGTVIYGGI